MAVLDQMAPPQREALEVAVGLRRPPLWKPLPGPQQRAYDSPADVLGYGGAAGGGKSQLLLGLAITRHRRSIIFRREAVQGRGLVDDARVILGDLGRFNEQAGLWRGLPGGRQIEFAGLKDAGSEHKYKGRPHDFIGFDEADFIPESVVRFLMGWLRTEVRRQRCRVVMGFNPPCTAEGRWVLPYFGPWLDPKHPHPAAPGELRWYAMRPDGKEVERPDGQPFTADGKTVTPLSRTFIPARVTDNPYYMATNYVAVLQALPEPLRSQLLEGDMAAGLEDDPWQVLPTAWVQAAMARWTPDPPVTEPLTALGVDVARGGKCKTVIAPRHGPWFGPLRKYPGSRTPDGPAVAALVLQAHRDRAVVNIDVLGVGGSAFDSLKGNPAVPVNPINNAEPTELRDRSGKFRLVNVRAASYWLLREALDPQSGQHLMLPDDPELLADLTAPRYQPTASGLKVEDEEDISQRIGRSPDCGDAVVLAHWWGRTWTFTPSDPRETSLIARLPEGVFSDRDLPERW